MTHPDDSILLAYARQQPLGEDWQSIHLHIAQCTQCRSHCEQYVETSTLLSETLVHFQYSQVYPSLVEGVIELTQHPAARLRRQATLRQDLAPIRLAVMRTLTGVGTLVGSILALLGHRLVPGLVKPRKNTMATVPMLSIIILLLLCLIVAVAVVLPFSKAVPPPFRPSNNITSTVQQSGVTVPSHSSKTATPTTDSRPTAIGGSTAIATPTTPGTSRPTLKLCSDPVGMSFSTIHICGSDFTPGDRVELTISTAGGQSKTRHAVTVDAQGIFQDSWAILDCIEYPVMVSAQDLTHPSEVPQALQESNLGQCTVPIPRPGVPGKY